MWNHSWDILSSGKSREQNIMCHMLHLSKRICIHFSLQRYVPASDNGSCFGEECGAQAWWLKGDFFVVCHLGPLSVFANLVRVSLTVKLEIAASDPDWLVLGPCPSGGKSCFCLLCQKAVECGGEAAQLPSAVLLGESPSTPPYSSGNHSHLDNHGMTSYGCHENYMRCYVWSITVNKDLLILRTWLGLFGTAHHDSRNPL